MIGSKIQVNILIEDWNDVYKKKYQLNINNQNPLIMKEVSRNNHSLKNDVFLSDPNDSNYFKNWRFVRSEINETQNLKIAGNRQGYNFKKKITNGTGNWGNDSVRVHKIETGRTTKDF